MEVVESRFLDAIDAAVELALPAGWPRVPPERLPARGSLRARHAFRLAPHEGGSRAGDCRERHPTPGAADGAGTGTDNCPGTGTPGRRGPAPYLAIVAAPPFPARTPGGQRELAALVDHVLERGAFLLLLFQHEDDPDGWIREQISRPHPRLLSLACTPPAEGGAGAGAREGHQAGTGAENATGAGLGYSVVPIDRRETLAEAIRDLWSGQLRYRGPCEGEQTIGVEIMEDECWRCRQPIATVTGIVFPDREVSDWRRPDWTYYRQLLDLARIPDAMIPALQAAVDGWRAAGASCLTVIRWRFSRTVSHAYWAAECPFCGSFRGDFPVMEERSRWLHDLAARRTGVLSYRPLRLDVPRQALQELTWGFEVSPHASPFGWYRAGAPEPDAPEPAAPVPAMQDLTPAGGAAPDPGTLGPARPAPAAPLPLAARDRQRPGPLQRLGNILAVWLGSLRRVP